MRGVCCLFSQEHYDKRFSLPFFVYPPITLSPPLLPLSPPSPPLPPHHLSGCKLGDPNAPLLLSVRSGAAISMPGMMDTVLNLGLTDEVAAAMAEKTGNPRFAYDSYRRFLDMFGDVVMGIEHSAFEDKLDNLKVLNRKEGLRWTGKGQSSK
jgi:hypothetical protein